MPPSEFSDTFNTTSIAQNKEKPNKMTSKAQLSAEEIICLPKKLVNETIGTKRFRIGEQVDKNIPEKVILIVGGTGCGKTTLINTLANYFNDVKFDDKKRFAIITEDDELDESGTCAAGRSKTRFVTAYEFGVHKNHSFRLTIVDTPGFGDTEGVDRDKKTVGYIKEWFSREQKQISAICIVIKYNETRIKPQVQYELHSVISLFGKNVENNVFMLFTFCDGSTPRTISTLQELKLPVKETFRVNSRAVLDLQSERIIENEDDLTVIKFYWKMTMDSFEHLFKVLKNVNDETLAVSVAVLRQREILDALVRQIPFHVKRIQFLVDFANQVTEQREAIDIYNDDQTSFELKEFETVSVEDDKIEANNCLKCQVTCHKDCGKLDLLAQKKSCLVFENIESNNSDTIAGTPTSYCQVCACPSTVHSLQRNIFKTMEQQKKIYIHEALDKFHGKYTASGSKRSTTLIRGLIDELVINDMKLRDLLRRIDKLERDLADASLGKSHQKTAVGRLKDELFSENQERKVGYEERTKILKHHQNIIGQNVMKEDFQKHWEDQFLKQPTVEENHHQISTENHRNKPKSAMNKNPINKQKCNVQ